MSKRKYRRTKAHHAFMKTYQDMTLFEFLDDTTRPFYEVVHWQLKWYEEHSSDALLHLWRDARLFRRHE